MAFLTDLDKSFALDHPYNYNNHRTFSPYMRYFATTEYEDENQKENKQDPKREMDPKRPELCRKRKRMEDVPSDEQSNEELIRLLRSQQEKFDKIIYLLESNMKESNMKEKPVETKEEPNNVPPLEYVQVDEEKEEKEEKEDVVSTRKRWFWF